MTYQPGPSSDRWNVNLPAVFGVVFVFLLAVIVWVVTSNPSEEGADAGDGSTPRVSAATGSPDSTASTGPATTSPAPMPDLSVIAVDTTAPTAGSGVAPTVTTAPGAEPGAVPGDLAIKDRPMQAPACSDSFITVIASAVGDEATAIGLAGVLDAYPGSNYLRTDQTCPSLTQDIDGAPIYVVYFGPFPFASDACVARADGTPGSYVRQLSDTLSASHRVACDEG